MALAAAASLARRPAQSPADSARSALFAARFSDAAATRFIALPDGSVVAFSRSAPLALGVPAELFTSVAALPRDIQDLFASAAAVASARGVAKLVSRTGVLLVSRSSVLDCVWVPIVS